MDLIQQLINTWDQVPGTAVINQATIYDDVMNFGAPFQGHFINERNMIFYICQQLNIIQPSTSLPWWHSKDLMICWLALHGIPRRSIAYAMILCTNYPVPPGYMSREQRAQIHDHYLKVRLDHLASSRPSFIEAGLRRGCDPEAILYRLQFTTLIWRAMEHALLDQGGEICTQGPGRGEIVYQHDGIDQDIDKLLLYRSIEGGGPRLSHGIPKRLKDLMSEGLVSEKVGWLGMDMNAWIESKLGYKRGDDAGEMEVVRRKVKEIVRSGEIPRMLTGSRPVVRRARIV